MINIKTSQIKQLDTNTLNRIFEDLCKIISREECDYYIDGTTVDILDELSTQIANDINHRALMAWRAFIRKKYHGDRSWYADQLPRADEYDYTNNCDFEWRDENGKLHIISY